MKKQIVLILAVVLCVCFLCMANAESVPSDNMLLEPEVSFTSDGSVFADALTGMISEQTGNRQTGNYITDVIIDGTNALISYTAKGASEITLFVYNDYETPEDKTLLYSFGPFSVSGGTDTVRVSLSGSIPEYFELEAQMKTSDGETVSFGTSRYTEAITFAEHATAADFKEGYYVSLAEEKKNPNLRFSPGKNSQENDSEESDGYVVYNSGLVLLPSDTAYTVSGEGENRSVTFEAYPQQLKGMTQEELDQVTGFVVRGENGITSDAVFMRGEDVALDINDDALSIPVQSPEKIEDIYEIVSLNVKSAPGEKKATVSSDYANGWVSYSPAIGIKVTLHGWKADIVANLGTAGSFELNINKTIAYWDGYLYGKNETIPSKKIKLDADTRISMAGVGVSMGTNLYVAASDPVYVTGEYGTKLWVSVGFSGFSYGFTNETVKFTQIMPQVANKDVFVYMGNEMTCNLEGLVFDFGFFTIGPVLQGTTGTTQGMQAAVRLDKDIDYTQGDDLIHSCAATGKAGCLSGKMGHTSSADLRFSVDLFFWDKSWNKTLASKNDVEPNVDYFYHSLETGEKKTKHGTKVECPHKLYRFSVLTTENKVPIENARVICDALDHEWSASPLTTDKNGVLNPLYLPMTDENGVPLSALFPEGDDSEVGTYSVTPDDLNKHREIILDASAELIEEVVLFGRYPVHEGDQVGRGKSAGWNEGESLGYKYTARVTTTSTYEPAVRKGLSISAEWDGVNPDGFEKFNAKAGLLHAQFVIDFSTYGDGNSRLAQNPLVMIRHSMEDDYDAYTIDKVTVSSKQNADGSSQPRCILTIDATFKVPGETDDYTKVIVKHGMNIVSEHYYRHGTTAVAISQDIADIRDALYTIVDQLDSESWPDAEKEKLRTAISVQMPPEEPFIYFSSWLKPTAPLTTQDLHPVVTSDKKMSYAAVTFTVPDVDEVVLDAQYSAHQSFVDELELSIREPVPGEFLNEHFGYSVAQVTTTPPTDPAEKPYYVYVDGLEGEGNGKLNLNWLTLGGRTNSKIRYNTTYTVQTRVQPGIGWQFRYPLDSDEGTNAYILVNGDPARRTKADLFWLNGTTPSISHTFTTKKALLLEIIKPDDVYFPEGVQPEVINAFLRGYNISIVTQDDTVTKAKETKWDEVTSSMIPKAGESFTVPCQVILPDDIRNEDELPDHKKLEESSSITIHIYGSDELAPPTALPLPGVYRENLHVALSTIEKDAGIQYYTECDGSVYTDYTAPIDVSRAHGEIATRVITAKTVKDGRESVEVTFTYILLAAETEYRLMVRGGTASCDYGESDFMYVPFGGAVTLTPNEVSSKMVFDHWEVEEGPKDEWAWTDDTTEKDKNAKFHMPAQDVTVTAVFMPNKQGDRLITDIQQIFLSPKPGDTSLPTPASQTQVTVSIRDERYVGGIRTLLVTLNKYGELDWDQTVDSDNPVAYGNTYAYTTNYTIHDLAIASQKEPYYSYDASVHNDDVFSPGIIGKYRDLRKMMEEPKTIPTTVDMSGTEVMVSNSFTFPAETYVIRYDANGGQLGNIPAVTMQLKTIPTELTEEKPYRLDGLSFLGWSTDPDATEPEYVFNAMQPQEFSEDITLYAVWAPYQLDIRWLDWDNHDGLRMPITVQLEDGTSVAVNPSEATEKNGVGVQAYEMRKLEDAQKHEPKVTEEKDGYVSFGVKSGKEDLYQVIYSEESGKSVVWLSAKRRLSVSKEWKIDLEGKDKPESVKMILQSTTKPSGYDTGILTALLKYIMDGSGEDFDQVVKELEKLTGYSLKGLSVEALGSKIADMIAKGTIKDIDIKDTLLSLLKADTDDSTDVDPKWYAHQTLKLDASKEWKDTFVPADRYSGTFTTLPDGSVSVSWNGEMKYRVVEKSGKKPVENGKDAIFKVPAYTNLAGKQVDEHKTVYRVKYSTSGDHTTVTNEAVEDHYLDKEWVMLNGAKVPDEVYIVLLWRYDADYLDKASEILDVSLGRLWLPEENPISGNKISVGDILDSLGIPLPLADQIKIPLAIAKLTEDNNWRAHFRVKKYGNFGLPLEHEGAEFFGAVCQDILQYFLGIDIPIGINPLKKFVTVSVPEFVMPLTTDYMDVVVNTWVGGDDDDDDDNKLGGLKIWKDDQNAFGVRPESVTLHLWENGVTKVADIVVKRPDNDTLNEMGVWSWTYKSKYIHTKTKHYSVTEDPVPGYETQISGLNVTNTLSTADDTEVNVRVVKIWDEETPAAHGDVTVKVLKNGESFATVTLNDGNGWEALLEHCDKYDENGNACDYSVTEEPVPDGYHASYRVTYDNASRTWNCYVTNTLDTPGKVQLTGHKYWDDNQNALGVRPSSVTIRLYADGVEIDHFELTKSCAWTWSREVEKTNAEGKEIVYTIKEDPLTGTDYTASYSGLDVTNTLKTDPDDGMSVEIVKVYQGTTDEFPAVPVSVQLYQNAEEYGGPVTLSSDNDWRTLFTGLDASGDKYTVRESPVPDGFSVSYSPSYSDKMKKLTWTVTNTRVEEDQNEIGGIKAWDDSDDMLGLRPSAVEYMVLANGEAVDSKVLNEGTGWTWDGVYPDRDESGKITYTVHELPITSYTAVYSKDKLSVTNVLKGSALTVTCTVVNGSSERMFNYTLSLQDEKGKPVSGTLEGVLNGESTAITLNGGDASFSLSHGDSVTVYGIPDGWQYLVRQAEEPNYVTWVVDPENLEEKESSLKYAGTVPDKGNHPDFIRAVKQNQSDSRADFYNDLSVVIQGRKTLDGETVPDELKGKLTFILYKDGKEVSRANNGDEGKFSFKAAVGAGTEASFTIREADDEELSRMYIMDTSAHSVKVTLHKEDVEGEGAFTVEPNETVIDNKIRWRDISGKKIWNDDGNRAKERPSYIIVNLLADGEPYRSLTVKPDKKGNWHYTFEDVPVFNGDHRINYTVTEEPVPYYTPKISGFDITNTYTDPYTFEFTFYKVWSGGDKHPTPDFTLYTKEGKVKRSGKNAQPKQDPEDKTKYTYWLKEADDYYVIETPMKDYVAEYENLPSSGYEDVTDRVYAGGRIINNNGDPKTGDSMNPAVYALAGILSLIALGLAFRKKKRKV